MAARDNVSPGQFQSTYENRYGTAKVTPTGYIRDVNVHHAHRGQGHGSELMRNITADADRIGSPLQLHARKELHPWYQSLGFRPDGSDAMGNLMTRDPGTPENPS